MRKAIRIAAGMMIVAMALGAQVRSDSQDQEPRRGSENRGPTLGVARVSLTDGDVRIVRGSGDEMQAQAGMPLVLGDRLTSGPKSRAEVQFDGGNFVRLSSDTEVQIGELGNKRFEIALVSGLVSYSQFDGYEADVDVETTLATVRPIKASVFAVEHHGAGQTDVTVRDGVVEVFSDDGIEKVKRGLLSVRGEPNDVRLRTANAEPKSGFDDWNKRRDKLLERDGRSSWQRWAPSYLGLGIGYGWGYPGFYSPWGFGPRYRTTVFYRAPRRAYNRGGGYGRGGGRSMRGRR